MFQKALQNSLFRYVFVGGIAYVIDIVVLIGFYSYLHTSREVAAAVSFWVGVLVSFTMQKLVAFQDYQKEMKALSHQALGYSILIVFNYVVTIVVVGLFPGKEIVFSRTLAVAITTLWNYVLYKRVIFRERPASDPQKDVGPS